jgi:hypothetical protein
MRCAEVEVEPSLYEGRPEAVIPTCNGNSLSFKNSWIQVMNKQSQSISTNSSYDGLSGRATGDHLPPHTEAGLDGFTLFLRYSVPYSYLDVVGSVTPDWTPHSKQPRLRGLLELPVLPPSLSKRELDPTNHLAFNLRNSHFLIAENPVLASPYFGPRLSSCTPLR